MGMSGYVHVDVDEIVRETDGAFLIRVGDEETWVPKACVADASDYEEGDENVTMSITESMARQKGLEGS